MAHCAACGATLSRRPILVGVDRLYRTRGQFEVRCCATCGSGVTFPLVPPDELSRFYPPEYLAHSATSGAIVSRISRLIVDEQIRRALRSSPLSSIARLPPGNAVDVGCGRGDLAGALVSRGWRVVGVEPSISACDTAAAKGVDARVGTLGTVFLEKGVYDAAIFQHSLEHTDDVHRDLRAVRAALRLGATIVVTVPNFDSWQRRKFGDRWFHLELPRHRVHFTRKGLGYALDRAGFEVSFFTTSTSSVGLPATIQYKLFRRCLFPSGLAFRVAAGLCVLQLPLARLLDRAGADQLHAVARARG